MNINYKQSQLELFPGTPGSSSDIGKPRYLFAYLTLSLENVIVLGILILMMTILAFSWGVAKGKKATKYSSEAVSSSGVSVPSDFSAQPSPSKKMSSQMILSAAREKANIESKTENTETQFRKAETKTQEKVLTPAKPAAFPQQNGNTPYTIQVASFKEEQYAKRETVILKKQGFAPRVITKGDYFIVCVGNFSQAREADKLMAKLKRKYNDSLIRRL